MSQPPTILAIDTALGAASIALSRGAGVAVRLQAAEHSQAQSLFPLIEEAMEELGIIPEHLSDIITTHGPGSFTGMRIGLASVRGLALALPHCALHAISTLEAFALSVSDELLSESQSDVVCAVLMRAGKGEFYAQDFQSRDAQLCAAAKPLLLAPDELTAWLEGIRAQTPSAQHHITGNAASTFMGVEGYTLFHCENVSPLAMIRALEAGELDDARRKSAEIAPFYIRAPDAKLPKK